MVALTTGPKDRAGLDLRRSDCLRSSRPPDGPRGRGGPFSNWRRDVDTNAAIPRASGGGDSVVVCLRFLVNGTIMANACSRGGTTSSPSTAGSRESSCSRRATCSRSTGSSSMNGEPQITGYRAGRPGTTRSSRSTGSASDLSMGCQILPKKFDALVAYICLLIHIIDEVFGQVDAEGCVVQGSFPISNFKND